MPCLVEIGILMGFLKNSLNQALVALKAKKKIGFTLNVFKYFNNFHLSSNLKQFFRPCICL